MRTIDGRDEAWAKKMEGVKKDEQHTLMELDSISPIYTSIAPNVIVVLIYFIFFK